MLFSNAMTMTFTQLLRRIITAAAVLILLPAQAAPPAARKNVSLTPEESFLAARDAFRAGNRERLALATEQFRGHPLEMYGDHWQLMLRRNEADETAFQAFLAKHDNSVLAERTRVEYLRLLGRKRAWEVFDVVRPRVGYTEDLEILCFSALAGVVRKDENALREAQALWLTPRELPEGCVALADHLIGANRLLDRHVWERIRALADANQLNANLADYR